MILFSKLPFRAKLCSVNWSSFHTVSEEPYNDVFQNPSGFITKCYSLERGGHREREYKQKCVCVVFLVSVCVGVCVIVRMTQTQCVSETE